MAGKEKLAWTVRVVLQWQVPASMYDKHLNDCAVHDLTQGLPLVAALLIVDMHSEVKFKKNKRNNVFLTMFFHFGGKCII